MEIQEKDIKAIEQNREAMLNQIRKIAAWLLVILIGILLCIDIFLDSILGYTPEYLAENPETLNIITTIKSLIINVLPVLTIGVFINPVVKYFTNIDSLFREKGRQEFIKAQIQPVRDRVEELNDKVSNINQFPEIYNVSYSYNETDWKTLLSDAKIVDLCMLYSGSEWNRKNIIHFKDFLERNGTINIYLPDEKEISNRFFEKSIFSKDTSDKIYRTISLFQSINSKTHTGNVNVKILKKGFNYVFARIEKINESKLFLISPYPNNFNRSETPVIIYNENYIKEDMKNFIESELDYLVDSTVFPDFEREKYIIWNSQRNRVFISTELFCPGGCKFCYVDSIVNSSFDRGTDKLARMLCNVIRNDDRFVAGRNGTVIMLGGFTDPFLARNFSSTIEIIDFFSIHGNFIHIAARYTIGKNIGRIFPPNSNVVINYSIASLRGDLEVANHQERFKEAKELINRGYKVALFLRPIIKGITIKEVDRIIRMANIAGIKTVTIGGLYVDDRIQDELKKVGISTVGMEVIKKKFVLDNRKVLRKLKIYDIDKIARKFQKKGFNTFLSSDQRIEYFKRHN